MGVSLQSIIISSFRLEPTRKEILILFLGHSQSEELQASKFGHLCVVEVLYFSIHFIYHYKTLCEPLQNSIAEMYLSGKMNPTFNDN